jgi:hypothetical protein
MLSEFREMMGNTSGIARLMGGAFREAVICVGLDSEGVCVCGFDTPLNGIRGRHQRAS